MTKPQIVEANKSITEILTEYLNNTPALVLCTQDITKIIESIILSNAKINKKTSAKDYSKDDWKKIAKTMESFAEKKLFFGNLNEDNIESIIEKFEHDNLNVKNIIVDDFEKLKSINGYQKLESFLIKTGAKLTTCSSI